MRRRSLYLSKSSGGADQRLADLKFFYFLIQTWMKSFEVGSDDMVATLSASVIQQVMPLSSAMLPPGHVLAIPHLTTITADAIASHVDNALSQLAAAFSHAPDQLPSSILLLAGQFDPAHSTVVLFQPQPLLDLSNSVLRTFID